MKRGDINSLPPGLKKAFTDALSKIPKTMEKLLEMIHYVDKERSDKRMADWWHNFQKGKPSDAMLRLYKSYFEDDPKG